MKKLIVLSPADIEYVMKLAKVHAEKRNIKGNFSKAISYIINYYKENHGD